MNPAEPPTDPGRKRAYFIDVLKLIVSFQMINGHTLNELLAPEVQAGPWFDAYTHFRGLVSVSFLVMAGLSFYLARRAHPGVYHCDGAHDEKPFAARLRRALTLIGIGYLLRFSPGVWSSKPAVVAESWAAFLRCDALQCIGLTLLVLELLYWRLRARVVVAASALALITVVSAPFADPAMPTTGPWVPLAAYFTHQTGSLFPLLPWAGFMFAGVVLGAFALPQGVTTPARTVWSRLLFAGAALYAIARLMQAPWAPRPPPGFHPATSPAHVIEKLAELALILGLLALTTQRMRRMPKILALFARNTLALYVIHLILLYRWPRFTRHFGPASLDLPEALMASLFVITLTVTLTLGLHALGQRRRAQAAAKAPTSAR